MKTIIEPFKIKAVEPIRMTTREERAARIREAAYREAGIRGVEIGSVTFGQRDPETGTEEPADHELLRLAIPRRVHTRSHIDYVVEAILAVWSRRDTIGGYRIVDQAPFLRHFTAALEPLAED